MDTRSDLAKARDAWLDSAEGERVTDGSAQGKYLRNRIEVAFIAGWKAKEKAIDLGRTPERPE